MALVLPFKRGRSHSPLRGLLNPIDPEVLECFAWNEPTSPIVPTVRRRLFSLDAHEDETIPQSPWPTRTLVLTLAPQKQSDWNVVAKVASEWGPFAALHEAWNQKRFQWIRKWSEGLSRGLPFFDSATWATILCFVVAQVQDQPELFEIKPLDPTILNARECAIVARKQQSRYFNPSDFVFTYFVQEELDLQHHAQEWASFDTRSRLGLEKKRPIEVWIHVDEYYDSIADQIDAHIGPL